ncbi:hypothetical protein TheveDRAFT_1761 [Thermanaerovibrio velox DSM 12556]|uniref:Motility protein n=1 Tax=Thermanaerovibrio velox DSM 12556 TaxID=926567 RepID=H0UR42_9BACT|nr:hypothetical protein [Thermanaerovibrio velox]EHM10879.1 hypothetical protein TheveDRAFT_1761 [Thermanaerovibrio velox DSM 12556]
METVSAVQSQKELMTGLKIQYAAANKIMKTAADLQQDMLQKLLGSMGIGNGVNIEA